MNFLDPYDIARSTTPVPPAQEQQPSLNEEVNQVIGQFSRFWGGFKKQSQTAIETARKDFSEVVVQAQKELSKLTSAEDALGTSTTTSSPESNNPTPSGNPESEASDSNSDPNSKLAEEQASTSTSTGTETPRATPSTSTQGLFARLQAALPPNVVATVQNNIPESLKHASENIDLNQIRTNLLTEFQRVQGVTRAQAEEYVHKSEILLRDAVKEAGEVLREAVKIVPPEEGGVSASGSGLMWDGTDMWMLPYEINESTTTSASKDKEGSRGIPESQSAVASRAEALVRRLKCDPSILRHDPEVEEGAKEQYAKWRKAEVESKDGGVDGGEWKAKIATALEETDGELLKQTFTTLVPSDIPESTFWLRYFFRAHQIHVEQEKRKALIQSTAENDDDFSWEDDEDETSPTTTKPPLNSALEIPQTRKSKDDSSGPSQPGASATPSPRLSRDNSFDVISSNVSLAGDEKPVSSGAGKPAPPKDNDDDDSGDSDWE